MSLHSRSDVAQNYTNGGVSTSFENFNNPAARYYLQGQYHNQYQNPASIESHVSPQTPPLSSTAPQLRDNFSPVSSAAYDVKQGYGQVKNESHNGSPLTSPALNPAAFSIYQQRILDGSTTNEVPLRDTQLFQKSDSATYQESDFIRAETGILKLEETVRRFSEQNPTSDEKNHLIPKTIEEGKETDRSSTEKEQSNSPSETISGQPLGSPGSKIQNHSPKDEGQISDFENFRKSPVDVKPLLIGTESSKTGEDKLNYTTDSNEPEADLHIDIKNSSEIKKEQSSPVTSDSGVKLDASSLSEGRSLSPASTGSCASKETDGGRFIPQSPSGGKHPLTVPSSVGSLSPFSLPPTSTPLRLGGLHPFNSLGFLPSSSTPRFGGVPGFPQGGLPPKLPGAADLSPVANKDLFFCHLCSFVGQDRESFSQHMSCHFEHRCPHCDYTSRTEGRLKRHIKDFHGDNPPVNYSGNISNESTSNNGNPVNNHSGTSNVTANTTTSMLDTSLTSCASEADTTTSPIAAQKQPGRPKVFKCRQCEYVTETKVEFWEHQRTHIKEEKMLQCPKCPFVTEYKHHLEYHLRNHFGSKPFKCTKCNYSCVNKSMLNSHMKSHTNVYQFRCADCTYATKYCHSLKLHLRKYNHKPATVLNQDGSLPVDGSGDFELVSKRGPPRGPRGPKKDKSNAAASVVLPNQGNLSPHPLNGPVIPPPAPIWPMFGPPMPNGLHPPPPLIPVSMAPLQLPDPTSFIPTGVQSDAKSKCMMCDFIADNQIILNQHLLKVHAAENQDLFRMFGLNTNAFIEEAARSAESAATGSVPSSKLNNMQQATSLASSASTLSPGKSSQTVFEKLQESQLNISPAMLVAMQKMGGNGISNAAIAEEMAKLIQVEASKKSSLNGDSALDLTKARLFGIPQQAETASGEKRHLAEDPDLPSDGMTADTNANSPGQRKRSRKGKAYKLDTICMKLQERYEDDAPELEDGSEDPQSDYTEKGENSMSSPDENSSSATPENGMEEQDDVKPMLSTAATGIIPMNKELLNTAIAVSNPAMMSRSKMLMMRHSEEQANKDRLEKSKANNVEQRNQDKTSSFAEQSDSLYECPHCHILFRECIMYTMHMGYHGFQDPFKCNMCGHIASNKVDFFLHIARAAHE